MAAAAPLPVAPSSSSLPWWSAVAAAAVGSADGPGSSSATERVSSEALARCACSGGVTSSGARRMAEGEAEARCSSSNSSVSADGEGIAVTICTLAANGLSPGDRSTPLGPCRGSVRRSGSGGGRWRAIRALTPAPRPAPAESADEATCGGGLSSWATASSIGGVADREASPDAPALGVVDDCQSDALASSSTGSLAPGGPRGHGSEGARGKATPPSPSRSSRSSSASSPRAGWCASSWPSSPAVSWAGAEAEASAGVCAVPPTGHSRAGPPCGPRGDGEPLTTRSSRVGPGAGSACSTSP